MATASSRSPTRARSSSGSRRERGFLDTIHGEPTIGGRYSALSPFGIVPAVLMGIDVHKLLDRAEEMREACRLETGNPGLELGLELGEGPDKVLVEGDFGLWVEQLLAESTGKQGKGLIPVRYGDSRRRPAAGLPRRRPVRGRARSSSAGSSRPRSPARSSGSTRSTSPTSRRRRTRRASCSREAASRRSSPRATSTSCSRGAREGDYVAILAFIDPAREGELAPLVERARATGRPVTVGLGPRYLHSTGQLHKGGPNTGLFVQVVDDLGEELPIPGKPFGFRTLIAAQAAGDFEALKERGRRIVRVSL